MAKVRGPSDMRAPHYVVVALLVLGIVLAPLFVVGKYLDESAQGIDYCAAVQSPKCSVVAKGEFVVVTVDTNAYVLLVQKGKVVAVIPLQ